MKSVLKSGFTLALALTLSAFLLGAAAPNQAEKVAQKMLDFDKALTQASTQIDATLTSMNAIPTASSADLASKYKDFTSQVKKLQSMADKAKSQSAKAASQREAYLKQWQASQAKIQNPQLQAASEARRNELMPKIEAIKTSLGSAKETFTPFMQDLNDLVLYLGNNLSAGGMTGAQPLMEKCNTDGATVKTDITAGQAAIKDLANSISPGGTTTSK
jgi:Skp family chaperone for outer membrane proteins